MTRNTNESDGLREQSGKRSLLDVDRSAALTNWKAGYRSIHTTNKDPRSKHKNGKQGLLNVAGGWTDATAAEIVRLAAAAPDLLEACEIMVRAFNVKEIDPLVAMASIEKARTAIAKATGN